MASAATSTQELNTFSEYGWREANSDEQQRASPEYQEEYQTLPPADSGKDAYIFLAACIMLEAMVWGLPFAVSSTIPSNETMHHTELRINSSVSSKNITTMKMPLPTKVAAQVSARQNPASCTSRRRSLQLPSSAGPNTVVTPAAVAS